MNTASLYLSFLIALTVAASHVGCVSTQRVASSSASVFQQRALHHTGRPLDIAIEGNGFFRLSRHDGSPYEIFYTRRGSFLADDRGQLLLTSSPDYRLDPPILIPLRVTELTVGQDGQISCIQAGNPERMVVGQILL